MRNEEYEYTKCYSMTEYKWNNLSMFHMARGVIVSFLVVYVVFFEKFCHELWFYLPARVFTTCLIPMAFIMSGYYIKKRKFFSQIFRICRKYLLSFLVVAGLSGTIMYVRIKQWVADGSGELRKVIWGYVYGTSHRTLVGGEETCGIQELWIFLALFIGLFVMNLLIRLPVILQYVGGILFTIAGYYLPYAGIEVYCLPQACMACGFLVVGYRLRESNWLKNGVKKWQLLLLVIIGIAGGVVGRMDMEWQEYRYPVLVIPCACMAGIFLLYLCIQAGWRWQGYLIVKILKAIGSYSLWITLIFHIVNRCLPMRKVLRGIGVSTQLTEVMIFLYTILYLAIGCAVLNYFRRLKYKGRKMRTSHE